MKKVTLLLLILLLISGYSVALRAQEKLLPGPLPYVLEVNYFKGRPLSYMALGGWAWYAAFPRIADWKPQPGVLFVSAVKLYSRIEGGDVRVKVTVLRGAHHDVEDLVAEYLVGTGKIVTSELANFGVVPFELALVRAPVTVSALPEVKNETKSLIVSLEPMAADLPKFKATMTNVSSKPVSGLSYFITVNGQNRLSSMPRSDHGEVYIAAGTSRTTSMSYPLQLSTQSTGDVPQSVSGAQLVISAVVFADGSYEGSSVEAARLRAFGFGEKLHTARVLELLRSDAGSSPEQLAVKADQLSYRVTTSEIAPLIADFPGLSQNDIGTVRICAEAAASDVQKDFKGAFGSAHPISPAGFTAAVDTAIKTYEKWLNAQP